MFVLAALEWLLAAPAVVALSVFSIECGLGLLKTREQELAQPGRLTAAILVPAHNEEAGIARTVENLKGDLPAGAFILVVADNCIDETANRAADAGAEVVVREAPERRSKAFALDFGREQLRAREDAPDIVIIIDADCAVSPGTIKTLMGAVEAFNAPVQAACLLEPGAYPPIVEVGNFAFFVKNWVRQKGLRRIGAPAVLNGTGMAFPWKLFDEVHLASSSLAEDLDLGIVLARAGNCPRFITSASVWSAPASEQAAATQRARWEGGFISAAVTKGVPLIVRGVFKRRLGLTWLGLHLLVPPLTLLMLASGVILLTVSGLASLSRNAAPVSVLLIALAVASSAVIGAWALGGRQYLSLQSALRMPTYFLWKAFLYGRMIARPEKGWIRTER